MMHNGFFNHEMDIRKSLLLKESIQEENEDENDEENLSEDDHVFGEDLRFLFVIQLTLSNSNSKGNKVLFELQRYSISRK